MVDGRLRKKIGRFYRIHNFSSTVYHVCWSWDFKFLSFPLSQQDPGIRLISLNRPRPLSKVQSSICKLSWAAKLAFMWKRVDGRIDAESRKPWHASNPINCTVVLLIGWDALALCRVRSCETMNNGLYLSSVALELDPTVYVLPERKTHSQGKCCTKIANCQKATQQFCTHNISFSEI